MINPTNPLNPELVREQSDRDAEITTARVGLEAIDELKRCKKGYPYLLERLAYKAKEFQRLAIEGATPEERDVSRLIYLKFHQEIIPMLDRDEENHRKTLQP